jgi:hypothetical protein
LGATLNFDGKAVIYLDHLNKLSATSGSGPVRRRLEYVLKALKTQEAPEIKWDWLSRNIVVPPASPTYATTAAMTYQEKERAKVESISNSLVGTIEVGQPTLLIDNIPGISFLNSMFLWDEMLRASDKLQIITALDSPWALCADPDVNHIALVPGYLDVCRAGLAFLKTCSPNADEIRNAHAEAVYDEWKATVVETTREKLNLTNIGNSGYSHNQIGYSSSSSAPPSPPTPATPSRTGNWGDDWESVYETSHRTSTTTYAGRGRSKTSEVVQGFEMKDAEVGIAEPCPSAIQETKKKAAAVAKTKAPPPPPGLPPVSSLVAALPKPPVVPATPVANSAPRNDIPDWSVSDIIAIQTELTRLRYYSFKIDGSLGNNTQRALFAAYENSGWMYMGAVAMLAYLKNSAPLGPEPASLTTTPPAPGAAGERTPRPSVLIDIEGGIDDLDELELSARYGYCS